jgi:hypothetical protein
MSYHIPDGSFAVDPNGSVPTITFKSNLSATHYHVQVKTGGPQAAMVVDATGLGKNVPIRGGPIRSAADFAGKRFFWDITLANLDDSKPVEAVLSVEITQDGNQLFSKEDDHFITGQESYYEFLDAQ